MKISKRKQPKIQLKGTMKRKSLPILKLDETPCPHCSALTLTMELPSHLKVCEKLPKTNFEDSPNDNRVNCKNCNRRFAPDRIDKHEFVCKGAAPDIKSREVFAWVRPPVENKKNEIGWKEKHKNVIQGIKEAKKVQIEIEAQIRNPLLRYIQCPHCYNKFPPDIAESHLAECKIMLYKPRSTFKKSSTGSCNESRSLRETFMQTFNETGRIFPFATSEKQIRKLVPNQGPVFKLN